MGMAAGLFVAQPAGNRGYASGKYTLKLFPVIG
jgi:hypothetical protein